ncbi:hypothetical protein [Bradyrhizobium sp. USDA 3262]
MKVAYAFMAAGLIIVPTVQVAAAEQAVLGQGNVSCRTWSSDRNSSEASARVAWILGFITAFHQYGPRPERDVSSGSSTQQITELVDHHCTQHPTDDVYRAVLAVIDEYKRIRN